MRLVIKLFSLKNPIQHPKYLPIFFTLSTHVYYRLILVYSNIQTCFEKNVAITREKPYEDTNICTEDAATEDIFLKYRQFQLINLQLNNSFNLYLEWFPSLLLTLVALLLFATLKVWYIDLHAYLLFPVCAMRCLFETMTPLALAGKVNEESILLLKEWKILLQNEYTSSNKNCKWLKSFHRSCPVIACTAGSFYSFENSIVLCTISNCVQLTTNLLLMSKNGLTR